MRPVGGRLIAAMLRLYPAAFRDRFEDEMLAAFHDHLDAVARRTQGSLVAAARLTAVIIRS